MGGQGIYVCSKLDTVVMAFTLCICIVEDPTVSAIFNWGAGGVILKSLRQLLLSFPGDTAVRVKGSISIELTSIAWIRFVKGFQKNDLHIYALLILLWNVNICDSGLTKPVLLPKFHEFTF